MFLGVRVAAQASVTAYSFMEPPCASVFEDGNSTASPADSVGAVGITAESEELPRQVIVHAAPP